MGARRELAFKRDDVAAHIGCGKWLQDSCTGTLQSWEEEVLSTMCFRSQSA